MNNNLKIDPAALELTGSSINSSYEKYVGLLNDLNTKFTELGTVWSGEDYEAAKGIMEQNKEPLNQLGEVLKNIGNTAVSAAQEYDQRIKASAAQYRV